MNNFNIKKVINSSAAKVAVVSVVSVLAVLLIVFGIIWHNRARVFSYFAKGYAESITSAEHKAGSASMIGAANSEIPSVFSDQQLVINAVSKANPAVVAISISKVVPTYKTSYQNINPFGNQFNPFGGDQANPFGNFNFQVPVQTPDGDKEQEIGAGSGFLVSADGMLVTNKHVVSDTSAKYTVHLSNGKKYTAKVLARDTVLDVAILKIEASGLPYLTLGDSDYIKLGQSVIAIGNALGQFDNTVSVGVVSGLSRSITAGNGVGMSEALSHVIQTDAAINPGNSGGPLLDLDGRVIGIDTAIVQGSQSIGFALPINSIKTVVESVRTTGKIVRPYIGIRYQQVTAELKEANNLSVDYGVIVKPGENKNELSVIPGSPGDKAGILENDIILEVNGVKLDKDNDFAQMIREHKVGDVLNLQILSKGKTKFVSVTLEAAPENLK